MTEILKPESRAVKLAQERAEQNAIARRKTYAKYTDDAFGTPEALEKYFHKGKKLKYDYVIVDSRLYTLHEYDMDGKNMTYANKKLGMVIDINTSNRYGPLGFTDAKIYHFKTALRRDINYAE